MITFEDLAPAAPGYGGHGLPVNTQYTDQGVTFNNPEAFDFSKPTAIPNHAHSGTVAVEPCVAIEFCTAPVAATFTAPQQHVKAWVGFSSALGAPYDVRLTAYNASNAVVGTANATLPARTSPTPIQTPLTVDVASPTITKIEVGPTPGGFANGLDVDDVEFSSVGPPPPCPASGPPTVIVSKPLDGLTVQNNTFLLSGAVDPHGAPITSASLIAAGSTTHTSQAFPTLIDSDGGLFGPINVSGLLNNGGNKVTVTATNCAGTGASSPRLVTLSPIPPGTQFHELSNIEVTQSVQNRFNSVPLVAATSGGFHRTIARVYLGLAGGASSVTGVSGSLTATRPDGTHPGGPQILPSLNTITVNAASTVESIRSNLDKSLNFELPREWLADGPRLHLQLDHLDVEGERTGLPCTGCDNPGFLGTVRFHTVPPVRIWLVRVPYQRAPRDHRAVVPTQNDIDMLASWLRRAYPTAEVRDTQMFMPMQADHPEVTDKDGNVTSAGFTCDDINSRLSDWVNGMQAQDPRTRYYGVVSDNAGTMFMRGCSESIGGRFGSGPSGLGSNFTNFSWDTDTSYADWYGGHELGHMYGRKHPGFCRNNSSDDDDYPYANGLIGSQSFDNIGVDVGNATLGVPTKLWDWRAGASDIMTYCDNEWMSDYTYRGILRNLCAADHPNCPDFATLGRSKRRAPVRRKARGRALIVNGSLALRSGRLDLSPLKALRGLTLTQRPKKSAYSIVLRGRRNSVVARYPFTPRVESDLPPRQAAALVHEVVPFKAATKRVTVVKGKRTLASVPVSAHAPSVRLLSPRGGKTLAGEVKVRWASSDRDGGRRTYSLLYSPNGKRYIPVAADLHKRSFKVDTSRLPGGSHARFRVIASDGVLTGIATSKRFAVPVKPPRVLISTPHDGATAVEGESIQLSAVVDDLQDAAFPASRVVWRSSLQGMLGTGSSITASLTPGTHEVSVTATNSAGKSATATVTVDVTAIPPTFDASATP